MRRTTLVKKIKEEGRWLVHANTAKGLTLFREYGRKAITMKLLLKPGGHWEIMFPSYVFTSRVSHFIAAQDEHRFCQNKGLLFSVVRYLQKIDVWEDVSNKQFFKVNGANLRAGKKARMKILREIMG